MMEVISWYPSGRRSPTQRSKFTFAGARRVKGIGRMCYAGEPEEAPALRASRDLLRAARLRWIMPLSAALSMAENATRRSSETFDALAATPDCAFFTASFMARIPLLFRIAFRSEVRTRFIADFKFGTACYNTALNLLAQQNPYKSMLAGTLGGWAYRYHCRMV